MRKSVSSEERSATTLRESSRYRPSYWHQPGTEPLCALNLGQVVDIAAELWGDREALKSLYQGHRFTFREARDEADRLAAGLLQLGLSPGDRLGIWGPNSSEWFISRLAAARAGLVAVLFDSAYQEPQLLHSVNKVEVKALICAEFFKSNSCYQILRDLIPELDGYPESGVEIKGSKTPSLRTLIIMSDKHYRGAYRLSDVMDSARPESLKIIRELQTKIQPDDGCTIHFSSGTTGSPKGVLLSNHSLVNNAIEMGRRFGLHVEGSKSLAATHFWHTTGVIGVIACCLCNGATCVIPAPVFDARKMLEGLIRERCTHMFANPAIFLAMIRTAQDLDLQVTTLQAASIGGAPCSREVALQIKQALNIRRLFPAYGMTELCVAFFTQPEDTPEQVTATVGTLASHVEAKVVDKEGRMVPMGTPGELWVRGYIVMLGYWNDEEKTRQFISLDGWAKTGDLFVLQEDGQGRIVGRLKDMIIRFGDNIFAAEIEDLFTGHPDILEAHAFGVPDPKVGEEICVFLKLGVEATLTEQDVRDYCRDKIAEYRIPRYIRFVKDFERTVTGKVQKFRLLEQLQKEIDTKK